MSFLVIKEDCMNISNSVSSAPFPEKSSISTENKILISDCITKKFDPGTEQHCVGFPQSLSLAGYTEPVSRQYIRGDGSCWARALWQNTLNQIFNDPNEFDRFIEKVANSHHEMNVPKDLVENTIHILYHLKSLSNVDRIRYLNHEKVDQTLIYFMRNIAGEFMSKTFGTSQKDVIDIKTNLQRYGGTEITSFARHFDIAVQNVFKRNDGKWVYSEKPKGQNYNNLEIDIGKINFNYDNRILMFAANNSHFEIINFSEIARKNRMISDLELARQLQKSDDETEALIQQLQNEDTCDENKESLPSSIRTSVGEESLQETTPSLTLSTIFLDELSSSVLEEHKTIEQQKENEIREAQEVTSKHFEQQDALKKQSLFQNIERQEIKSTEKQENIGEKKVKKLSIWSKIRNLVSFNKKPSKQVKATHLETSPGNIKTNRSQKKKRGFFSFFRPSRK